MGAICSHKTLVSKSFVYIKSIQKSSNIKVPLSAKEVNILKKTWPPVKNNWLKICLVAFERWFTLYPQLRYMFRSLPEDIQFEDLFKTDALKMHVDKVRDVLELLINKIDNVEELVNTLVDFGRQHHMLGAEQRYATALAASFQYGICMIMDVDSSVENAWDSLLRFVMDLLKLGMRMEKEAQEKESLNKGYNTEELLEKAQDGGEALDENENSAPMPLALINEDDSTSSVRTFHVAEADPDG